MIENDVLGRTANELMDYLASDGCGREWVYLGDLTNWDSLYNLTGRTNFVAKCIGDLVFRGLAETRRLSDGRQVQLTPTGESFANERQRAANEAWAMVDMKRFASII